MGVHSSHRSIHSYTKHAWEENQFFDKGVLKTLGIKGSWLEFREIIRFTIIASIFGYLNEFMKIKEMLFLGDTSLYFVFITIRNCKNKWWQV